MSARRNSNVRHITRACLGMLGSIILLSPPVAHAVPTPQDPTSSEVASSWMNPNIRPTDGTGPVTIDISSISMPAGNGNTASPTDTVTVTVKIHNSSTSTVRNLNARVFRAEPVGTTALARTALAMDDTEFQNGTNYRPLNITIDPAQDATVSVAFNPNDPALRMNDPAVYPVMVSITGTIGTGSAQTLDSERFLLPIVNSTAPSAADASANSDSSGESNNASSTSPSSSSATSSSTTESETPAGENNPASPQPNGAPITLIWPLTGRTNVLAGETGEAPGEAPLILSKDTLADELANGGRLYNLLDQYTSALTAHPNLSQATCIAIDPDLLNTVSRMSRGYFVDNQRPNPVSQPLRLRDSWTKHNDTESLDPGTGQQSASEWMQKLQHIVSQPGTCVVALPWADSELSAVNRTGNQWLMREAVARGNEIISQILNVTPLSNVVLPESGYVTEKTASALTLADNHTTVEQAVENSWQGKQDHGTAGDALNDSQLPEETSSTGSAANPVRVLVADNTIQGQVNKGIYSRLYNGSVVGVSFQGSLAATLATVGTDPQTTGYSNPDARFDYAIDSATARAQDASASLRLAVSNYLTGLNTNTVIVNPPHYLDGAEGSQQIVNTVGDLLESKQAYPVSLTSIIQDATPPEGPSTTGTEYSDPAEITDTEALRAKQQANYTEDLTRILTNDPQIALTRFRYTEPLMEDLLRSLTGVQRRSMGTYLAATFEADTILNGNRDMLRNLRSAITLLPPGNVYTRTSPNSPLLIVARNGLPLPLNATLGYSAPDGDTLDVPSNTRIPARGSITISMTANIASDENLTNLRVWLATEDGSQISSSVDIAVQTRSGFTKWSAALGVSVLLIGVFISRLILRRRRNRGRHNR
ncbi:MAG: hypothetical protein Q3962_04760 [Corynebacterium sp.]|nr:hypothetical protein [Corynebacterium sp.]